MPDRRLPELIVVTLQQPKEHKGRSLPPGSQGTVVHAYQDHQHYEVEFVDPIPCILTLGRDDIEPTAQE